MDISLAQLIGCAKTLAAGTPLVVLGAGVRVTLRAGKLTITERSQVVFHMKVKIAGGHLLVDYPRTTVGYEKRGWARLGMLLALRFASQKGCTTVAAETMLEANSYSFWVGCGIQFSIPSHIENSIIKIMRWISVKIRQPQNGTSIMTIRVRQPGNRRNLTSYANEW
ncbi:MAG: hypothetical protein GY749_11795 [Desulfobacteraceae bacterium]|nr:hypothetical protein [Desulfobacteraceae bacterium]